MIFPRVVRREDGSLSIVSLFPLHVAALVEVPELLLKPEGEARRRLFPEPSNDEKQKAEGERLVRPELGWSTAVYGLLYSALLVAAGTDLSHKIIPNVITFPGIVVGLVSAATVLPLGLVNGVIGLLVGGGILWFLAWVSPYLFGKEGMGGGDIKLLAMIGAFLGWKPALMTIMVGSLLGSLVGVSLIAAHVIKREDYIPFGPFLVCGAVISLFFWQPLLDWYLGLLAG